MVPHADWRAVTLGALSRRKSALARVYRYMRITSLAVVLLAAMLATALGVFPDAGIGAESAPPPARWCR